MVNALAHMEHAVATRALTINLEVVKIAFSYFLYESGQIAARVLGHEQILGLSDTCDPTKDPLV